MSKYEVQRDPIVNTFGVDASNNVVEGQALGLNSGNARRLQAGDVFLGFADRDANNSDGSAGDINVDVRSQGIRELTVAGSSASAQGTACYASDHETYTVTSTSNSRIGKLHRQVSGTTWMVAFESDSLQSV